MKRRFPIEILVTAIASIAFGASFALPRHASSANEIHFDTGLKNASSPAEQLAKIYSGENPEIQLAHILQYVERSQLDAALKQAETLTREFPNFHLGQLIKGDLLLARAQPLQTFGNASDAAPDRLFDLRAEALARLSALREKPRTDLIPDALMQLRAEQKFAIVIDTAKSRLYLFQNDQGIPRFVTDYYITHGKLGTEKTREGDKKTPIGVYHITSSLPIAKLGDFYGSGAFPINYPNDWDKRQGRNGHGIWLHGTPSDTYSRPPKASDGCVVLSNTDLNALAKKLQIGLTPVVISNNLNWLSAADWQQQRDGLRQEIERWRNDWESLDVDRYLSHYSNRFSSDDNQNLSSWSEHKRRVGSSKKWLKVTTEDLSIFRNPGEHEMAVVTFRQDYRSDNLKNVMKKRQYWQKEAGRWKIIYEGSA